MRSAVPDRHTGGPFSLRWILIHTIEETCRHNGHLDLLREAIDGAVGEGTVTIPQVHRYLESTAGLAAAGR